LVEQGFVKVVRVKTSDSTEKCIQMIKPFTAIKDEIIESNIIPYMFTDMPIPCQIYRLLLIAGDSGLPKTQIQQYLSLQPPKSILRYLEKLVKVKGNDGTLHLKTFYENIKSVRQTRYIAHRKGDLLDINLINRSYVKIPGFDEDLKDFFTQAERNWDFFDLCPSCRKYSLTVNVEKNAKLFCCELCANMSQSEFTRTSKGDTVTISRRELLLLELIKRNRFMLAGKAGAEQLEAFMEEIDPQVKGSLKCLDIKVFSKLIQRIVEKKMVKIVESFVELLDGRQKKIQILMEIEESTRTESFRAFLREKENQSSFKTYDLKLPIIETEMQVDQLVDSAEIDGNKEDDVISDSNSENDPVKELEDSPHEIASHFGFCRPKNQRLQIFHKWLFEATILNEADLPVHSANSIVLMKKMPIGIYTKVIGVFIKLDEMQQFLAQPGSSEKFVSDLPSELRIALSKNFRVPFVKLLQGLFEQDLIDILEYNLLCEEYFPVENCSNPNIVFVKRLVQLKDFTELPPKILDTFKLEIAEDVSNYWAKLQFDCLKSVNGIKDPKFERIPSNLHRLFKAQSWRTHFVLPLEKKRILDQYIDLCTGNTPLENDLLCSSIAEKVGISVTRVKAYFTKMKIRYFKQLAKKSNAQHYVNPIELKNINPNYSTEQKSDNEDEAVLRRPRKNWSSDEDDILMCGFVLLDLYRNNFFVQMKQLYEIWLDKGIGPSQIRNRIKILKTDIIKSAKIHALKSVLELFIQNWDQNNEEKFGPELLISKLMEIILCFRDFYTTVDM
jgi:hypothetical protein